jgi:hypothetical protein
VSRVSSCAREIWHRTKGTHLEDDVLREDVLDRRHDVLGLALGELDRLCAALEHGAVLGKLGHLGELLGVRRLRLARRRCRGVAGAGCARRHGGRGEVVLARACVGEKRISARLSMRRTET